MIICTLYITLSRIIFIKTIINFKEQELLIQEQIFGSVYKIISIPKSRLVSLQEKQKNKNSIILFTHDLSLIIHYRRKDIELAKNFSPEAKNKIKEVYEHYRNSELSTFYSKIKILTI